MSLFYRVAEPAALMVAWERARHLQREDCLKSQAAALNAILRGARGSVFARERGLDQVTDEQGLRRATPVATYEEHLPYLERALRGESNVLTGGFIKAFAVSSGTAMASSKYLPVNAALERNFRRGGLDALLLHVAGVGRGSVFGGRQLFLGGSTALKPASSDPRILCGDLSGIMARRMPALMSRAFYSPGLDLALESDWLEKLRTIAERTVAQDVRAVAGVPAWLLVLFEAVRERWERSGRRFSSLHDIWPGLEVIIHGGVSFPPYQEQFARWLGRPTRFQEVYPASEGFVAVGDQVAAAGDGAGGMRLLTDAGLFFEFLPAGLLEAGRPPRFEAAVGLADVEVGVDYALVMTTPAGLWRYLIGDVVRFDGLEPPRLRFVGRTRLELSAFGEHVIEFEVVAALAEAASRLGLLVRDFTVAPIFPDPGRRGARGRHQWLIELDGIPSLNLREVLPDVLDYGLQRANDDYRGKRRGGSLGRPEVLLLPVGSFAGWLTRAGKLGGQHKVPRLRSDRLVADAVLADAGAAGIGCDNPVKGRRPAVVEF